MKPQMTVLTLEANGRILGVVTRAGDPQGTLTPAALVGEGLPIDKPADGTALLVVDPQYLKVETVDFTPDILFEPLKWAVVQNQAKLQAPVQAAVPPAPGLVSMLSTTTLRINTTSAGGLKVGDKVFVQIENPATNFRKVFRDAAVVDGAGAKVEFNLSIPAGSYNLLIAVPGFAVNVVEGHSVP